MHRPAKILTIEDESSERDNIIAYLEDSGYDMMEAENGRVGIEKLRTEKPDLILCDLRMPEVDGLDVLWVAKKEFPEIPVLVVSGAGVLDDAIEALKLGAWDYVTKPIYDMAILEHAVRKALERAELLKENREYREHLETLNIELNESLLRLEEDEEAGRLIQFQLLPRQKKSWGEYEFSSHLQTSMYLSGDFVDYFIIDKNHLGFYMADVSGHGVSSAFITVLLKSYINLCLDEYRQEVDDAILNPHEVLSKLNRYMLREHLGKYLTMFYAVIHRNINQLHFSNGGQFPFPILYGDDEACYLENKGLPIGLFEAAEYNTNVVNLPKEFNILLASDGVLEVLEQSALEDKLQFLLSLTKKINITMSSLLILLNLKNRPPLPDDATLLMVKKRA